MEIPRDLQVIINHSFLNEYECAFNFNLIEDKLINFQTTINNENKLKINNVPSYTIDSNIENYHTHPNHSSNILSFVPSYIDIESLITSANFYKSPVKDTIFCSSLTDENKLAKLEYSITNMKHINKLFDNKIEAGDIFNNIAYDYLNNHHDLDIYIKDYKESGLENVININIFI
jgi:hypothetical protein